MGKNIVNLNKRVCSESHERANEQLCRSATGTEYTTTIVIV